MVNACLVVDGGRLMVSSLCLVLWFKADGRGSREPGSTMVSSLPMSSTPPKADFALPSRQAGNLTGRVGHGRPNSQVGYSMQFDGAFGPAAMSAMGVG